MTEYLKIEDQRIAYDVVGEGPLVVLSHGMGDTRNSYRFLVPMLVEAGYRVANVDLRGSGESSVGWASYSRTDTANDLLAVVRHLGGPAVLIGQSFSGGAVAVAAAQAPELVSGIVQIAAFSRAQKVSVGGLFTNGRYRKGFVLLMFGAMFKNIGMWKRYLDHAFPAVKPADYAGAVAALEANLAEPGRMAALNKMGMSAPTDAGALLPKVQSPALVINGTLDPDWADPRAEAEGIVAELPAGIGTVVMIEGAGHYPHTQFPGEVAAAVLPFLKANARA
jgi:pimeloyl-ACP methyl ester carboxylesterase